MFTFKREGTQVKLSVEAKSSVAARWYEFNWNCSDDVYADLLVKAFELNLEEKMKQARKDAYAKGWADAKAKRKRESWFGGYL